MTDPPSLKEFTAIADASVAETISMFLRCPCGFHGDTGIQHYLYHRLMANGGQGLIWPPEDGARSSTLLVQSEHCTKLPYCGTGVRPGRGRFDMAFIDPESVDIRNGAWSSIDGKALVAFEVGRNKPIEKLGEIDAPEDAASPRPGDAAKLVRALRYGKLAVGYLLEFFEPREPGQIAKMAEVLHRRSDEIGENRFRVALAVYRPNGGSGVDLYPTSWAKELGLPSAPLAGPKGPRRPETKHENRVSREVFTERCGPCGADLQTAIHEHFHGGYRLLYGGKNMTVNAGTGNRLLRIGNKKDRHGECVYQMRPDVENALRKRVPPRFEGNRIVIPNDIDENLIRSVVEVLAQHERG